MVQAKQDLEPTAAALGALGALLEAAVYTGYGTRTAGRRLGRRAAVVGAEGARRAGGAFGALRGGLPPPLPPPRRPIGMLLVAATAGGVVAALAIRGMARRASGTETEPAQYLSDQLRPAAPGAAAEPPTAGSTADRVIP
jgi:hypothetical protein